LALVARDIYVGEGGEGVAEGNQGKGGGERQRERPSNETVRDTAVNTHLGGE
jgi:hypothetical protein